MFRRYDRKTVFGMEYNPDHHRADKNGYVKMPGIDQMTEMVNMIEAAEGL